MDSGSSSSKLSRARDCRFGNNARRAGEIDRARHHGLSKTQRSTTPTRGRPRSRAIPGLRASCPPPSVLPPADGRSAFSSGGFPKDRKYRLGHLCDGARASAVGGRSRAIAGQRRTKRCDSPSNASHAEPTQGKPAGGGLSHLVRVLPEFTDAGCQRGGLLPWGCDRCANITLISGFTDSSSAGRPEPGAMARNRAHTPPVRFALTDRGASERPGRSNPRILSRFPAWLPARAIRACASPCASLRRTRHAGR